MANDRHSVAETAELITDEVEKAKREAENGIRQFHVALEMIRGHVWPAPIRWPGFEVSASSVG